MVYPVKKVQRLIFPRIYANGVKPITKGSRKESIGWMSSKVSYEQSYILKNLYEVNSKFIKDNDESMALKSTLIQNYLSKHWGS